MDSSTNEKKLDPRVERLLDLIVEARRVKGAAVSGGKTEAETGQPQSGTARSCKADEA
jgi:hypothetical protein